MRALILAVFVTVAAVGAAHAAEAHAAPPQIPLCMIGDSITWADKGDYWRKYLLEHIPRLAFVGTHSAALGYSHAGEGGNSTHGILKRMADIPDCPYYSLHIGTNDNNLKDESRIPAHAQATADRIEAIVNGLLHKPGVSKVFLGSIMPCHTNNPLRDKTNSATNVVLRGKMQSVFPADKVVWVEYEKPLRAIENWEPLIRLHPTVEGYKPIARILADTIAKALELTDPRSAPEPMPGAGVRVENLWEGDAAGMTRIPVIAGWYTISFDVTRMSGKEPSLAVHCADEISHPYERVLPIKDARAGVRAAVELFTNYEGGKRYTRSRLKLIPRDCEISNLLFEKRRPSGQPSTYGTGSYLDTRTPPALGELVERPR